MREKQQLWITWSTCISIHHSQHDSYGQHINDRWIDTQATDPHRHFVRRWLKSSVCVCVRCTGNFSLSDRQSNRKVRVYWRSAYFACHDECCYRKKSECPLLVPIVSYAFASCWYPLLHWKIPKRCYVLWLQCMWQYCTQCLPGWILESLALVLIHVSIRSCSGLWWSTCFSRGMYDDVDVLNVWSIRKHHQRSVYGSYPFDCTEYHLLRMVI
jgi:hypothetical protein